MKQSVAEGASTNISSLTRDSEVSRRTMQRLVHEDLGMKSYRMDQRQFLSIAKEKRKFFCCYYPQSTQRPDAGNTIIFSEAKWWTIEEVHNRQNRRYLSPAGDTATTPEMYRIVPKKQRTCGVMFLCLVAFNGLVSPPIWVDEGMKINSKCYIEILKNNLLPWV